MIAGKLPADRSFEAADGDLEKTPARSTSGLPRRCVDFWASVFGLRARFRLDRCCQTAWSKEPQDEPINDPVLVDGSMYAIFGASMPNPELAGPTLSDAQQQAISLAYDCGADLQLYRAGSGRADDHHRCVRRVLT